MEIDKVFNNDVDGVADNLFSAVKNSVSEIKAMQQRKAAENVQLVIRALKKLETELRETNEDVANQLALRIASIKDGRDGKDGKNGKDGRDGKAGRDGKDGNKGDKGSDGRDGVDGVDGVSVVNANIDFDGSLVITLSDGRELNVGEVVAPDLAERIKVISTMSTNGAVGIKDEGTSISTGVKNINFVGATVTATNSGDDVTVNVSAGTGTVTSVAATVPTFLSVTGSPVTTSGTLAISLSGTALPVANGGTGVTTSTGTTNVVLSNSPTLVTPVLGAASASSLSNSGNLTFTGTGNRITGDFSNATDASRVLFQTSTTNNNTAVGIIPNGTGAISTLVTYNNSDTTNASLFQIQIRAAEARLSSGITGTGTYAPMTFYTNGSERARIDTSGNVGIGTTSPLGKVQISGTTQGLASGYGQLNVFSTDAIGANKGGKISFGGVSGATGYDPYGFCSIGGYKENATSSNFLGYLLFATSDAGGSVTERMRITSAGDIGIGTASPTNFGTGITGLTINGTNGGGFVFKTAGSDTAYLYQTASSFQIQNLQATPITLWTSNTERMRIDSSGRVLVGTTSTNLCAGDTVGIGLNTTNDGTYAIGAAQFSASGNPALNVNRKTDDGNLVTFSQAGTQEGTISVSGTTVSYNGGHLSRYAQTTTAKDNSLVKGTVLSNLDEMNVYTDAEGNPVANEQLNKVKVSNVEGDANVAGVFVNWTLDEQHNVDEINMAMTGDMIIRIAQGTTVQRGDLLMSAGDGTAKPQGDDICRSKTIAKVTSTHVTCTYEDGSYCVPCVLMAC